MLEATAAAERRGRRAGGLPRAGAGRLSAARPARACRRSWTRRPRRSRRWRSALAGVAHRCHGRASRSGCRASSSGRRGRQQRRADRRRPGRRTWCASRCCRPTTCSTSGATSSRRPTVAPRPVPRPRGSGISICEDIWNDADFWPHRLYRGDPIEALVQRGRRADRQHLGLALHDREAPPAPAHAGRDRARAGGGRWCSSTRWAARTIWCSTAPAWRSTRAAQVIARGAEHDVDLRGRSTSTRGDGGRRSRRSIRPTSARRWRRWRWARATTRAAAASRRRCSGCRAASTRRWSRASPRGRSGPRQVLGVAMPSRYSSPGSLADAEALARALGIDFTRDPDRADVRRLPRHAGAAARRVRARASARGRRGRRRSDRAEPAGARARRDPDGAVQPAGSAAARPPATRASSRPATARCTATWRAGSR